MEALVGEPSRAAPEIDFALGGRDFRGDIGRARLVGDVPFNVFARAISAARINLNITRRSHATVSAPRRRAGRSSSPRPAPRSSRTRYEGIERWFEPGRELLVVHDADEALAAYRELLADPAQAEAMGARARERVLDEHTYAHRARQLLELVAGSAPVPAAARVAEAARASRSSPPSTRRARSAAWSTRSASFDPGFDVVVVDDGSTDAPPSRRRARARTCVRLPFNLGIGGAVQTGFRYALEHGFDLAVRLDGDGQHDPRSCRSCSSRCCAARPTSSSARASPTRDGATGPRSRAAIGIRLLRAGRLAARRASA